MLMMILVGWSILVSGVSLYIDDRNPYWLQLFGLLNALVGGALILFQLSKVVERWVTVA